MIFAFKPFWLKISSKFLGMQLEVVGMSSDN
jgi:hypothetical protein